MMMYGITEISLQIKSKVYYFIYPQVIVQFFIPQIMACPAATTPSSSTQTTVESSGSSDVQEAGAAVRLVLRKPKNKKKVVWSEGTVDNEDMNKRKSKCCCIYKKPHVFGESSSDTDDECENCHGHMDARKSDDAPPPPPAVPPVS